jgi:hypothetical protein
MPETVRPTAGRLRCSETARRPAAATVALVAMSTLQKIESGRVIEPGYFTMLSLADALGVDLGDLA